ncbi:MAG: F0F1 ATP synthase subunit B [Erysipelotrichaceae bacterium]|nr:F0F1 ATP synthase subunit B [Erysipelotrichaceae bacterium]
MDIISVIENLMPNPLTVITQLCATLLMFILLKKLAWNPVKKIMAERTKFEQDKLIEAENLRKENEELKEKLDEELKKADKTAQETIERAQKEGQRLKDELVEEGKQRSQQIVNEAQHNAELQKAKLLDEMHDDIVEVALSATEKMLGERQNNKTDRQIVDDFIKEVSKK